MGLLYEELSYVVRGCIYDVHNELGVGYDEENPKVDIIKVQTYLKALNLPLGLLVHFGKKQLEIYGVTP